MSTAPDQTYLGGVGETMGRYGNVSYNSPSLGTAYDETSGTVSRVPGPSVSGLAYQKLPSYTAENAARWGTDNNKDIAMWQQMLYNAGYYKKNEVPALGAGWTQQDVDAMTRAMTDSNLSGYILSETLAEKALAVTNGARALFYGSSDFATAGGSGGGTTTTQKYISLTSKTNADQTLRKKMVDILGRQPTKEEYKTYLKTLNANERKFFKQTKYLPDGTQMTTGTSLDIDTFTNEFVLAKANFATDAAGQVGELQDGINTLISNYGLNNFLNSNVKTKYLKQVATGELSLNDLEQSFKSQASDIYTGFATQLKDRPTLSLKDIASPYLSTYSNMLEVNQDSLDIQDALSKATNPDGTLMNVFDYKKSLYKDSRYQLTNRAAQEASDFGRAFARSMGVNL